MIRTSAQWKLLSLGKWYDIRGPHLAQTHPPTLLLNRLWRSPFGRRTQRVFIVLGDRQI